jgi:hypothetical protein
MSGFLQYPERVSTIHNAECKFGMIRTGRYPVGSFEFAGCDDLEEGKADALRSSDDHDPVKS